MSFIDRVQVVRQDLALIELAPLVLILLEVLDEGHEVGVTMCIDAEFVPDGIGEPAFADVLNAKRVVKAC